MTKAKLIELLEEMGYEITEGRWFVQVGNLFTIEPRREDVYIHEVGTYTKQELQALALISEYLNTPAAEREDKRYTYKCAITGMYLHITDGKAEWLFDLNEGGYFTATEIENISGWEPHRVESI